MSPSVLYPFSLFENCQIHFLLTLSHLYHVLSHFQDLQSNSAGIDCSLKKYFGYNYHHSIKTYPHSVTYFPSSFHPPHKFLFLDPIMDDDDMERYIQRIIESKEPSLNLSNRSLRAVPSSVRWCTFLQHLYLNNNELIIPPSEQFSSLINLETLFLRNNPTV